MYGITQWLTNFPPSLKNSGIATTSTLMTALARERRSLNAVEFGVESAIAHLIMRLNS